MFPFTVEVAMLGFAGWRLYYAAKKYYLVEPKYSEFEPCVNQEKRLIAVEPFIYSIEQVFRCSLCDSDGEEMND